MNRRELRNLVLGAMALTAVFVTLELAGRVVADAWARGDLYPDHHHTYSISGTVIDGAGRPFAGVSIEDGRGHNTTTDSSGNYALSGLPAGTYDVFAYKAGFVFSPQSWTVSLPPDATGRDFSGLPERPVIIIPGTGGSANWPCFLFEQLCDHIWDWTPSAEDYYQALITRLRAAGYTEHNRRLFYFFYDWRKPPAENAAELEDAIDGAKWWSGSPTVDLVAHSQGGLVARSYIQGSSYDWDVAHLVTLGTPHYGIPYLYAEWEGGATYGIEFPADLGIVILARRYIAPMLIPQVFSFRWIFPSMKDMLPTFDYLYDQEHGNRVKYEWQMIHRNTFLPTLNANLSTLFARTDVTTFAATSVSTPMRFYVHDRPWWWWPNWDDGAPSWDIEWAFRGLEGDSTVPVDSALLPSPAHTQIFPGVKHGDLPNSPAVADAVLTTLGIPLPFVGQQMSEPEEADRGIIVLMLDGPAQAFVIDPGGRTVGPGGSQIPEAQYISQPGELTKLILIPAPAEGRFLVGVQGEGSGAFELSLLDTFNPRPTVVTDTLTLWDSPRSQIEPGVSVSFALTYTAETSPTVHLMAWTPMLSTPVWAPVSKVDGRAGPGQTVEIRDADSQALLGSGTVDADGHFEIGLTVSLQYRQRIYPLSGGVAGVTVTVDRRGTFLPTLNRGR